MNQSENFDVKVYHKFRQTVTKKPLISSKDNKTTNFIKRIVDEKENFDKES